MFVDCDGQPYEPREETCCNGVIWNGATEEDSCCGMMVFDSSKSICCDGKIFSISDRKLC